MDNQKELFTVVDKNDRIKGYFTRYECHHNKKLIHRIIGAIVFNNKGHILLQKRSKHKDTNPGFYTISVSGHVAKGETYKQTAKREMFEELGIYSPLKRKKKFIAATKIETEMACIFEVLYNGPFAPNKQEIDEVKFVTISKLKQMKSRLTPFALITFKQLEVL